MDVSKRPTVADGAVTAGVKRGLTIALTSTFVGVAAIPFLIALWRTKVDVSAFDIHLVQEVTPTSCRYFSARRRRCAISM